MIRVIVENNGRGPVHIVETADSPQDKGLDTLAKLILDVVDVGSIINRKAEKAAV